MGEIPRHGGWLARTRANAEVIAAEKWSGVWIAAVLACTLGPQTLAHACSYHGVPGLGLSAAHPGAVDVAMAIDAAASAGTIEIPAAAPPASMVAYHRMVKQIERFRELLDPEGNDRNHVPGFSLLLIDTALWSRFAPSPSGFDLSIHTEGPMGGEPGVLSSTGVIRSVIDGRLPAGDAVSRGLIRVEAGIDEKLALFDLLSRVPHSAR